MTRFTIIGGGGRTALAFTKAATEASHIVHNIVRNDAHDGEIKAAGGKPVLFSFVDESEVALAEKLKELDTEAVLFAAGTVPGLGVEERAQKVDFEGAVKTYKAMQLAKIKRVVTISSVDARDRSKPPPAWYDDADIEASDRIWKFLGVILAAKYKSDSWLIESEGLNWTILRPGGLTASASKGKIQLGKLHLNGTVTREDVALAAVALFAEDKSFGLVTDVQGPNDREPGLPIKEAVRKVVGSA